MLRAFLGFPTHQPVEYYYNFKLRGPWCTPHHYVRLSFASFGPANTAFLHASIDLVILPRECNERRRLCTLAGTGKGIERSWLDDKRHQKLKKKFAKLNWRTPRIPMTPLCSTGWRPTN